MWQVVKIYANGRTVTEVSLRYAVLMTPMRSSPKDIGGLTADTEQRTHTGKRLTHMCFRYLRSRWIYADTRSWTRRRMLSCHSRLSNGIDDMEATK